MIVRDRLVLTFFLVVGVLVLPSIYAVGRLDELRELAVENRAGHARTAVALGRVQTAVAEMDRFLRSYVATPSPALAASLERALEEAVSATATVAESGYAVESRALRAAMASLAEAVPRVVILVEEGRLDEATDRVLGLDGVVEAVGREVAVVATAVDARAGDDFRLADAIAASTRDTLVLAMVAAILLAALLGIWTTRGLAVPLERLGAAMAQVSEGEGFEAPEDLPYDRPDEIGALAESFRTMTRRLGELDRLKVEFMGVASHELKTPINVIRGYAELIEEELETELTEGQADILHRIAEQTQAMSRMVSRLMDISRLETGNFGMEPEPVLVQDLLVGLERRFEILAQQRGVAFVVTQAADAPERLEVDVDLVRDEVLGNLVANALRFTSEGGTVRVEAGPGGGGLLVRVSDTGPGIPEQHRPYIFERYFRGERTRGLGTGLGLAICRQVAEAHGGWVRLADDGTPGAVFHVFLPRVFVSDGVRVSDYDYELDPARIARYPADRRDGSRLLVVPPGEAPFRHLRFGEVGELLRAGDVLVVNESRVRPARLLGRKPTGASAEVFLLRPVEGDDPYLWTALVRPGSKLKPGRTVIVADGLRVEILDSAEQGGRVVRLVTDLTVEEALARHGHMPLPPYIDREAEPLDRERYQTVYARTPGSVAAPTAGLHFTEGLLAELEEKGVRRAAVTLHVGIGTFRPVETEDPSEHAMHPEWYEVTPEAAETVNVARAAGGRVWAVGTTAVRTLESVADAEGRVRAGTGSTELFIRPPYPFRVVDCLLTNFHLPRSTLLMLVAALAGYERTMAAYAEAVAGDYRFYSYGDAMAVVGRR